jgi:hypothetical protein
MLTAVGALAGVTGVWLDYGSAAAAALTALIALLYWVNRVATRFGGGWL